MRIGAWRILLVVALGVLWLLPGGAAPVHATSSYSRTVASILSLPYTAAYVPVGLDRAFSTSNVPNTAPAEDYTSGSIPGSPDSPAWPPSFKRVVFHSADGAPLIGELDVHPGSHPAVLVVHGFNTHGSQSVIRWAAMLAANGYNVLAADQRDFSFEYSAGYGYPSNPQTFGWKEGQDVLAAGRFLHAQRGVLSVGVVGFSEGAQNTILAMAGDTTHVFAAGLTFSGPADQDTQVYSTAEPAGCHTPTCTYPVTDALIALVVPPYSYTDPCSVLNYAAARYHTSAFAILSHESAMHAQSAIHVPLLNFYAADDSLVAPFNAELMSAYESGNSLQRTVEIQHGEHAYYFDRWWQQMAILTYFHNLLPGAVWSTLHNATVNATPGGTALSRQTVAIPVESRRAADASLAPDICNTALRAPGRP